MFKSKDKRFITRGINAQCSEELRVLCWGLIDELVENEEVEVDYLQIFELKRHSSNHSYILSHHQVEQILKNPIYTGVVGSKSKNLEAYISDEVIPIVSHEVYQKAVHKRESRTQQKKDTRTYPLRKKIICPECGMKLMPRKQVSKGHDYYYYACQDETCRQCLINADYIEGAVVETFDSFINQEEQFRSLIRATNENIIKLNQSNTKSLELLDKKKKLLFQSFEKGEVNQDEMKSKLVELNKEQENITDVDLCEEELSQKIKTFFRLSNTSSKKIIWSYVDKITLTKNKKLQEVFINEIKIQPRFN